MQYPSEAFEEIQKYKDAVWAYMMEHCDILEKGSMFVKFHTDSRKNFEKHVWARYKYDYHREDWKSKAQLQEETKRKAIEEALEKKRRHREERRIRLDALDLERRVVRWALWYQKTQQGTIFQRIMGYIASKTWKKKPTK